MHNFVKRRNTLSKFCCVNTARFLKYVWPFYNILHEGIKCATLIPSYYFYQMADILAEHARST